MATKINTDIWGEPTTWIDVSNPPTLPYSISDYVYSGTLSGLQAIEAKIPYLPISTYQSPTNEKWRSSWRGALVGSKYDGSDETTVLDFSDPIDISKMPVCWGIGKDSSLAHSYYVLGGYISGTSTDIQQNPQQILHFEKPLNRDYSPDENGNGKVTPFCFTTHQNVAPYQRLKYQYKNYDIPVNGNFASYIGNLNGQPILSFNYQKVVVYPMLICGHYDSNSLTGITVYGECSIGEYFDGINGGTPRKNTEPLILCVFIKTWYMGSETTPGRTGFGNTLFAGLTGGTFDENETLDKEFRYNGSLQRKTSAIRDRYNGVNQWQSLVPTIAMNGIISGALGVNSLQNIATMTQQSTIADIDAAWIMATQSPSPIFDILFQNGKYEVYVVQRKTSATIYSPYIDWCTVWDTELTETTKDDVLRDVAFLGFWFSEDATVARTGKTGTACDSSLMHIPVFDRNGVTTGEWKSGTDAAQEPNASWNNPYEDNPYTPSGGGDENDFGYLDNHTYRGLNFYNLKMYALTELQLLQFLAVVNVMYTGDPDAVQMDLDFKGSNPNEYIVGLYGYPFDIPNQTSMTTINIGPVDTGVQCRSVDDDFYGELSFGSIYIAPYYNDFRDYEPYTTIEIYVPLCGTVKLDPALYVGHTVSLYYDFDPATGNLSAKICRDDLIDKVIDGSICVQIPITATNMGDYQRSIHQIKSRILQTAIGAAQQLTPSASFAMAAATENVGGMISNAPQNPISVGIDVGLKAREIRYDMTHNAPHVSVTGTADPLNAINMDNHAYVFIKRAKMIQGYDADIYSHTVGNACIIQSLIGDMSGLIRCSNVDLSGIPATADEITAINNALKGGIYV